MNRRPHSRAPPTPKRLDRQRDQRPPPACPTPRPRLQGLARALRPPQNVHLPSRHPPQALLERLAYLVRVRIFCLLSTEVLLRFVLAPPCAGRHALPAPERVAEGGGLGEVQDGRDLRHA